MHKLVVPVALLLWLALAAPAPAAVPAFVGQWGTQGNGQGQFNQPRAVATDSAGNVYVADSLNSRIQKFTADGTYVTQWGGFAAASPNGVAVDTAGNVYAGDTNNSRVRKFTADGTVLPVEITGLSQPQGVAVDAAGNIYVAEYGGNRVQKYDAAGNFLVMWGSTGTANGQFTNPNDLALDTAGNVYVADESNRVQKFDPNGGFLGAWGGLGPADGQFSAPRGLSIGAAGLLNVADFQNRRIQRFGLDGTFTDKWGDATVFNRPSDVAESADGNLYVTDQFANRILRFFADPGGRDGIVGALPPPVLGQAVNVAAVKGTVLVAVPGGGARAARAHASQKGLDFVPLSQARQIPTGSFLDTKRGTVSLTSATGSGSKTQSGRFNAGIFQVLQSRRKREKGLTELRLKGASFSVCRARTRGRRASASKLPRRLVRQLKSNAKGRFRTRGRHSAATVRGTKWVTADRCDGTLTSVQRGTVAVRDFRRRRTIIVRAGKRYLARAPG